MLVKKSLKDFLVLKGLFRTFLGSLKLKEPRKNLPRANVINKQFKISLILIKKPCLQ